jgi:hypothetical protein
MSRVVTLLAVCLSANWGLLGTSPASAQDAAKTPSKFEQAIKDAKKADGLWTVYFKDQQILVDLKNSQQNTDFLMLSSIARGVSQGMVIGGMTWGDDVLWSFRKVGDKMHVLRKNVRFKAKPGSPEANAVKLAYTDSVLYALPIVTDTPGGQLVDMTRVFLSDDEQIGQYLGASFAMDRSTVASIKSFSDNVELQINAVYSTPPSRGAPDTVADGRGMQVTVHYSISKLPSTGYRPRLADDRIGYFLVVTKDFTDLTDDENFVRYVTRWDLQKKDPSLKVSPPVKPIKFYIEKTVPVRLRATVWEGISEWNKAFEKLGFANAIQVEYQSDEDTKDPEDVNYNFFRWITAEAGFAMGPSRVNPLTGQILDADIIFDASFLRSWKHDYETFTPQAISRLLGEESPTESLPFLVRDSHRAACSLSVGMQQQMGFAAAAFATQGLLAEGGEVPEEFTHQALKEVVMHEVGHTLGLRHNFKASAWKTLDELSDPDKHGDATVASVMDYAPSNICAPGSKQGAFFTKTIGPYDYWAIEYGYKVISGDEKGELAKIAARSGEPGHDYATDEDARGSSHPDPMATLFDLGKDPIAYAERQSKIVGELLPKVVEKSVKEGDGYQRARQAFGILQSEFWRTALFAAKIPGGISVRRDHKGDAEGRAPFEPIAAEQQRAAMKILASTALAAPSYTPEMLNSLMATRWSHWGINSPSRVDYPVHSQVGMWQDRILSQLMGGVTLERLLDNEMKVKADADAYTLAEHFRLIVDAVFSEVSAPVAGEHSDRKPFVASYRRNLQRNLVDRLGPMAVDGKVGPQDAQSLARMHLKSISDKITASLAKEDLKLDDYSRAHLTDLKEQINRYLTAPYSKGGAGGVLLLGF